MGCNNKHILEGIDEGEKFVGELLNHGNDKIQDDDHENIGSSR